VAVGKNAIDVGEGTQVIGYLIKRVRSQCKSKCGLSRDWRGGFKRIRSETDLGVGVWNQRPWLAVALAWAATEKGGFALTGKRKVKKAKQIVERSPRIVDSNKGDPKSERMGLPKKA